MGKGTVPIFVAGRHKKGDCPLRPRKRRYRAWYSAHQCSRSGVLRSTHLRQQRPIETCRPFGMPGRMVPRVPAARASVAMDGRFAFLVSTVRGTFSLGRVLRTMVWSVLGCVTRKVGG